MKHTMQPATTMGQKETPFHNGVYEGATDIALKKQLENIQHFIAARASLRTSLGCNASPTP